MVELSPDSELLVPPLEVLAESEGFEPEELSEPLEEVFESDVSLVPDVEDVALLEPAALLVASVALLSALSPSGEVPSSGELPVVPGCPGEAPELAPAPGSLEVESEVAFSC